MFFLSLLTRCKNEPFIEEFVEYYLREGVDRIHIIDDDSSLSYSDDLLGHPRVTIYFEKDIIQCDRVNQIYTKIKNDTLWLIYVDVDEYVTTKRNSHLTIRTQLEQDFDGVDCIKVPWVMMSANGRQKNPKNLLKETIYRWNHDKRHPNTKSREHKFRCRYEAIEVKSIFKPRKFKSIWDHHPKEPLSEVVCVEGVYGKTADIDPFYPNLREKDIERAFFVCYHYRIISVENSLSKIKSNIWYRNYVVEDLMSSDYAEIVDETLKLRVEKQGHDN